MAIPKYHEFMKPVLLFLDDGEVHKRSDIYDKLAIEFQLTEEEKEAWLPSGKQLIYKNRIGWALTYLKKADLIESQIRATYSITTLGKIVLKENPIAIDQDYLMKFDSFKGFKNNIDSFVAEDNKQVAVPSGESPQEMLDGAYKAIISTLADEVLNEVMNQSSDFFEKLVVDLLVAMGYGGSNIENSKVLGKSGDEGIDGVIKEDKLGFDRIYVQAKRWDVDRTVGRPELQKFVGALTGQGASKGAFITTAGFSKEAREYVSKQLACKIALIDGESLVKLMIEYNLGVSVESAYLIKKIDLDYFND